MQYFSITFWPLVGLLGLCLGSFLNVVITRLPVMLMRQWRQEARDQLALDEEPSPRFNLAQPRSMCPRCETSIAWHDNLPLIGWLKRRGRCAHCNARISVQYPFIELAGGILAISITLLYGISWQAIWLYGACLTLLVLAVIDWRVQLLPDILT
ncbi:MAG: prepilin peptidase, partial [Halomonas sp.]|nr:prepilin peptidase [Halomonas sp.]